MAIYQVPSDIPWRPTLGLKTDDGLGRYSGKSTMRVMITPTRVARHPDIAGARIAFQFLPDEFVDKCCALVKDYHTVHGFSCLPDVLWRSMRSI